MKSQEKTFEAIAKLQEIELELHRLRNALDRANKALDAQRTWAGLTDDEIEYAFKTNSVMVDNGNAYMVAGLRAVNIAQAIEAKLKEKNT
jgi:hypothetical protein